MHKVQYHSIADYIAAQPATVQPLLHKITALVIDTAPAAEQGIGYGMPCFKLHKKPLVYFAAYKNHIGIYALPATHAAFQEKLAPYKQGKGSVQFPLCAPIPFAIIKKMVAFRTKEIIQEAKKPLHPSQV